MEESFFTISDYNKVEITEKKSRFIAEIFPVNSTNEVIDIIKDIKKKYYDAKHYCFAYCIIEEGQVLKKCSDDGEPKGTAGEPILNIIEKKELKNILIVVTRYFGGILLGTGGLTRAYSSASQLAVENSIIVKKQMGIEAEIELKYEDNEKFKYYCDKNHIKIVNINYKETIIYKIELNVLNYELLKNYKDKKNGELNFEIINLVKICQKYVESAI